LAAAPTPPTDYKAKGYTIADGYKFEVGRDGASYEANKKAGELWHLLEKIEQDLLARVHGQAAI
jgi:hypothetical protein